MFFRRSIDSLVSKFQKLEDQLIAEADALQDDALVMEIEAENLTVQAGELEDGAEVKHNEAERALRIAARVGELIE